MRKGDSRVSGGDWERDRGRGEWMWVLCGRRCMWSRAVDGLAALRTPHHQLLLLLLLLCFRRRRRRRSRWRGPPAVMGVVVMVRGCGVLLLGSKEGITSTWQRRRVKVLDRNVDGVNMGQRRCLRLSRGCVEWSKGRRVLSGRFRCCWEKWWGDAIGRIRVLKRA